MSMIGGNENGVFRTIIDSAITWDIPATRDVARLNVYAATPLIARLRDAAVIPVSTNMRFFSALPRSLWYITTRQDFA